MRDAQRRRMLVLDAGGHRAGVPLAHVREIMRPLPLSPVAGAPPFVLGVAIIRGASVPVVDLGGLLGAPVAGGALGRFATLEVDGRAVALAVSAVLGVSELDPGTLSELPPLLSHAASEAIELLGVVDAGLLLVLRASRLVPDVVGAGLEAAS
jgi:purine-binding chemotaxis protein CheW